MGMAEGAASAGREQPGPGAGWSWLRRLAAAEAELVEGGAVGEDVHVAVLGLIDKAEGVFTGCQVGFERIGQAPGVEGSGSAMWHHDRAEALAVNIESADGAFVFCVDRAVGIAVDEVYQIASVLRHTCGEAYISVLVQSKVNIAAAEITGVWSGFHLATYDVRQDSSPEIAYRLACKGFIAVLPYCNHLILTI